MKLCLVLNEGLQLSRVCFITVLTCECLKSFGSITVIKNDTKKSDWTTVGIHHDADGNTQRVTCVIEQPDCLTEGGPFSNRGKNDNNNKSNKKKERENRKNRENGLLASAVANEISRVDQSEIMIQGMAS